MQISLFGHILGLSAQSASTQMVELLLRSSVKAAVFIEYENQLPNFLRKRDSLMGIGASERLTGNH
jgi:hypothetical protein